MSRALIIGFDAFGNLRINPSETFARGVAGTEHDLLILPTSYGRATKLILDAIHTLDPDIVLMFGYASSARGLRLERHARNRDHAKNPDNDGVVRNGQIATGGPDVLSTSAEVDSLAGTLAALGHYAYASEDAGGYVCNHVYYEVLRAVPGVCALLVHIPQATWMPPLQAGKDLVSVLGASKTP